MLERQEQTAMLLLLGHRVLVIAAHLTLGLSENNPLPVHSRIIQWMANW